MGIQNLINRFRKNPFRKSRAELLRALQEHDERWGWGITGTTMLRLARDPIKFPCGPRAFLALEVRLGTGSEGVRRTWDAHMRAIQSIFTNRSRASQLLDGVRLHNGDETHEPGVRWVSIPDIMATQVEKKRGLSDVGLALVWQYPEFVMALDYEKYHPFGLAGYEAQHNYHPSVWGDIPVVSYEGDGQVFVDAVWAPQDAIKVREGKACALPSMSL